MAFPCMSGFHMSQDHTFGDQLTLFATANLFNVNIQIASLLATGAIHVFQPTSSIPIATLTKADCHITDNFDRRLNSLKREGL